MTKYNCSAGNVIDMLTEECAEVIQACMKANRFGLDGAPGYTGIKPREEINKELGDVLACIELIKREKGLSITDESLQEAKNAKLVKLARYFKGEF